MNQHLIVLCFCLQVTGGYLLVVCIAEHPTGGMDSEMDFSQAGRAPGPIYGNWWDLLFCNSFWLSWVWMSFTQPEFTMLCCQSLGFHPDRWVETIPVQIWNPSPNAELNLIPNGKEGMTGASSAQIYSISGTTRPRCVDDGIGQKWRSIRECPACSTAMLDCGLGAVLFSWRSHGTGA